jgi:iron complex outermembrane receptor protein
VSREAKGGMKRLERWVRTAPVRVVLLSGAVGLYTGLCQGQEQATAHPQTQQETSAAAPTTEPARDPLPVIHLSDPAAPADARPTDDGTQVLEDIIVTASKRRESIRDIPLSIDAFTASDLETRGATGSQDALLFSPGVSQNAYYSPTLTQVEIRGTTTQTEATNQAAPTGAFLDDVTLGNPSLVGGNPNIDVFDLERVEVLKGPQGTLFGGATLAGALRSIPRSPKPLVFEGSGFVSRTTVSESDNLSTDWGAALNIPLGSAAAVRAMSVTRAFPGAIDNLSSGIPDVNSYSVTQRRAMAYWEPWEGWTLEGMIHTLKSSIRELTHTDNPGNSNTFSNETGFSPSFADYKFTRLGVSKAFDTIEAHLVVARVEKEDIIDVQADRIAVQTPARELLITRDATADTRTAELRFNSIGHSESEFALLENWNWVAGLYHLESDQGVAADYQSTDGSATSGLGSLLGLPSTLFKPLSADIGARAVENALYSDATRGLGEHWDLTLGLRLFKQLSDGIYTQSTNGLQLPSKTSSTTDKGVLPKVALTWHVSDSLSVRGLAVKGFRFAGFNAVILNDGSVPLGYDSDSLWNYEIGLRSDWFGGRLRADVTGFLIDWSKIQIAQTTAAEEIYTVNAGRARNVGVESALTQKLPFGLTATANAAYIDARISEDFESADGHVPAGTRLPGTPHLTGSAVLMGTYDVPFATIAPSVTWTYQGEAVSELLNGIRIPAYSLLGAGLTLTSRWPGQPALTIGGSNLANTHGYTGAINLDTVTDYIPLQPRMLFVRLSANF